jgi:hypothetical protein
MNEDAASIQDETYDEGESQKSDLRVWIGQVQDIAKRVVHVT